MTPEQELTSPTQRRAAIVEEMMRLDREIHAVGPSPRNLTDAKRRGRAISAKLQAQAALPAMNARIHALSQQTTQAKGQAGPPTPTPAPPTALTPEQLRLRALPELMRVARAAQRYCERSSRGSRIECLEALEALDLRLPGWWREGR